MVSGWGLSKKYTQTFLMSKDNRFRLMFHPMNYRLNELPPPGLILEEKMGDEFKQIYHVPYDNGNWHEMECTMLNAVDDFKYDNDTKKHIREFIWNEIVDKKRESFENE